MIELHDEIIDTETGQIRKIDEETLSDRVEVIEIFAKVFNSKCLRIVTQYADEGLPVMFTPRTAWQGLSITGS